MNKNDDSPLSSHALLAEVHAKLDQIIEQNDRQAGMSAQAVHHVDHLARLVKSGQTLDARGRLEIERFLTQFRREFMQRTAAPRDPSRTVVVADAPSLDDEDKTENVRGDITGVVYFDRGGKRKRFKIPRIPTRYLLHLVVLLLLLVFGVGVVAGRLGMKPGQVIKAAAPLMGGE